MIQPGVYQAVDPSSLQKLQDEHKNSIDQSKAKAKIWAKHKEEYKVLQQKLSTIADKTEYNVMVPFGGNKAFFEGQLIHTNEIMVLLGDNWFVERSAKQASEICQRRLSRCDEMLEKIDKEIALYQSWQREANQLGLDSQRGEGNIEIREPYDEEQEAKWRVEHRERLRAEKSVKSSSVTNDEDIWRRLDELELEEELDAHLDVQKDTEDSLAENDDDDLSESPPLTDDEEESFDETTTVRRSVSFGDVSERLFSQEQDNGLSSKEDQLLSKAQENITKIIEFEASKTMVGNLSVSFDPRAPSHPGDLLRLFSSRTSRPFSKGPRKSILKSGSKYGPPSPSSSVKMNNVETRSPPPVMMTPRLQTTPPVMAVKDVVIERPGRQASSSSKAEDAKTPVTQVFSRFRATRVHQ